MSFILEMDKDRILEQKGDEYINFQSVKIKIL